MDAKITSTTEKTFTVQITVAYGNNMLSAEESLQCCLNEVGSLSTIQLLEYFDADGSPIIIGGIAYTTKGKSEKEYQTPYGAAIVNRHVYQTSKGGKTYVPLEIGSKMIGTVTPKFAKMVSSKYSCDAAPGVQRDLAENHNRPVAVSFIKNLTDMVGSIAIAKEETWDYKLPDFPNPVASISAGLDGTCLNMKDYGWREAMCGTIAFFDKDGERMHTIYTAASPEYGKEKFLKNLDIEIGKITTLYPDTPLIGVADGASCNWTFLKKHCSTLTVDFWHVTEYLAKAAKVMYPGKNQQKDKERWLDDTCHRLKHKAGIATRVLNELIKFSEINKLTESSRAELQKTITYLSNQKKRMQYHKNIKNNYPIGSGVTEAACKTIVKNRMCKGSAKWKDTGASVVLTLRSLHTTKFRWGDFWNKYSQYGCGIAA